MYKAFQNELKQKSDKNKAYRKNIQLLRIVKERLLTYIPLGALASSKNRKEKN